MIIPNLSNAIRICKDFDRLKVQSQIDAGLGGGGLRGDRRLLDQLYNLAGLRQKLNLACDYVIDASATTIDVLDADGRSRKGVFTALLAADIPRTIAGDFVPV